MQRIVSAAQLARSLSTLAGGTPLVEALKTTGGSMTNQVFLDRLTVTTQQVLEGSSLATAARATELMPEMGARMIEAGGLRRARCHAGGSGSVL